MSWFRRATQPRLSPADQGRLDRLRALRWPEFEALMAATFESNGYEVEKTGKGGLDGDIDLVLRRGESTELVQCKPWKRREVGIAAVREMAGVLRHRGADAVWIVCSGAFTDEAREFAKGQPLKLVDATRLVSLVGDAPVPPLAPAQDEPASATPHAEANPAPGPACPRCGAAMYQRFNPQTSGMYWGCVNYPRCKGSRPLGLD